jgi:hypothetical protein
VLAGAAGRSPLAVADVVEEAVLRSQPGLPRDDLALVALGVAG